MLGIAAGSRKGEGRKWGGSMYREASHSLCRFSDTWRASSL